METEIEPLTSVVLELAAKPESDIITKHCWKAAIWNKPQSYVSLFAVLFSLTVFSHKALWKEEKDHLLKWNLRSDGLELVEGEHSGMHPRGGGGDDRPGGGSGEEKGCTKSPLTPLGCGQSGWRPPMLSNCERFDWFNPLKRFKLLPVFPQISRLSSA